jgi:hypothetical protein
MRSMLSVYASWNLGSAVCVAAPARFGDGLPARSQHRGNGLVRHLKDLRFSVIMHRQ